MILFVCTGNMCRSPMAEAIARTLVPGAAFASAGTWAGRGSPATREAIVAAAEVGADLSGHRSRPVTAGVLRRAEHVYVMTGDHRRDVVEVLPGAASRVELLDPGGDEIADPYGRPMAAYRACRDRIVAALEARSGDWRLSR